MLSEADVAHPDALSVTASWPSLRQHQGPRRWIKFTEKRLKGPVADDCAGCTLPSPGHVAPPAWVYFERRGRASPAPQSRRPAGQKRRLPDPPGQAKLTGLAVLLSVGQQDRRAGLAQRAGCDAAAAMLASHFCIIRARRGRQTLTALTAANLVPRNKATLAALRDPTQERRLSDNEGTIGARGRSDPFASWLRATQRAGQRDRGSASRVRVDTMVV